MKKSNALFIITHCLPTSYLIILKQNSITIIVKTRVSLAPFNLAIDITSLTQKSVSYTHSHDNNYAAPQYISTKIYSVYKLIRLRKENKNQVQTNMLKPQENVTKY